jgi:hypothetical protein
VVEPSDDLFHLGTPKNLLFSSKMQAIRVMLASYSGEQDKSGEDNGEEKSLLRSVIANGLKGRACAVTVGHFTPGSRSKKLRLEVKRYVFPFGGARRLRRSGAKSTFPSRHGPP